MAYTRTFWGNGEAPYINATNLNNIESGIFNNDAAITVNTGSIASNLSKINTNTSNISTNAAGIATNADNIQTNADNIAQNTADIAALGGVDLSTKADVTYVDSENAIQNSTIADKADSSYVDSYNATQDNAIALKADTTYVDTQDDLKLNAANPVYTGTLYGATANISDTLLLASEQYQIMGEGTDLTIEHRNPLNAAFTIKANSKELALFPDGLFWGGVGVVVGNASDTNVGGIKIAVSGTDCYITTDGSTPGP